MDGLHPDAITPSLAEKLLDRAFAHVLVVGHTHVAFRLELASGAIIINPAALLRAPAEAEDNPPAPGTFGLLELPSCAFTVHSASDGREVPIVRRFL